MFDQSADEDEEQWKWKPEPKNGLEMAHKLSLESVFAGSVWLKTDCTESKIITSIWRHELIQPSELISRY